MCAQSMHTKARTVYDVAFRERIFCGIQFDKKHEIDSFCESTLLDILIFCFSLQTVVGFIKKRERLH